MSAIIALAVLALLAGGVVWQGRRKKRLATARRLVPTDDQRLQNLWAEVVERANDYVGRPLIVCPWALADSLTSITVVATQQQIRELLGRPDYAGEAFCSESTGRRSSLTCTEWALRDAATMKHELVHVLQPWDARLVPDGDPHNEKLFLAVTGRHPITGEAR